jgi:threonine/homoserine/homoserine lactone efflux protein
MMLLSPEQFFGFLSASLLITLSPGPDNLLVLSTGASKGRKQGMAFGLGCGLGCLSHTVLAALGISALIAASPWAFMALKLAGGAYLIYLGWQALRSDGGATASPAGQAGSSGTGEASVWRLFGKGMLANAINPKVVMFFLAFLPQFVVNERGDAPWQIAQLGLVFTVQAAALFGLLGYFAGHIGRWFARSPRAGLWLDRMAGTVFVALGLKLMISR